jgi:hypothetical protein
LVDSFSQGLERSYAVRSSVLHGIEPWLKDFHQLLLNPPKVNGCWDLWRHYSGVMCKERISPLIKLPFPDFHFKNYWANAKTCFLGNPPRSVHL